LKSINRINLAICLGLALTTLVVYWPVGRHEFIRFDDNEYIYNNPHTIHGLTAGNVVWAVASMEKANWFPVSRLAWMADWQAFGDWAGGHHLVSLALHTVTGILLFLVLTSMTGRRWPSAAVAALFLLHPLHVETVAWAVDRADVLTGLFFVLMLAAWTRQVRGPSLGRYAAAGAMLALGLAAKQSLMTAPAVLILLDWWPLGRVRGGPAPALDEAALDGGNGSRRTRSAARRENRRQTSEAVAPGATRVAADRAALSPETACVQARTLHAADRSASQILLEKIPLFVIVAAAIVLALVAHSLGKDIAGSGSMSLPDRLANASLSYVRYLLKTIWPSDLSVFYPYDDPLPVGKAIAAGVLLAVVTAAVILLGRRRPYLAVGWFWFLGMMLPTSGVAAQVGGQAMADRYTYLPLIGIFIMVAFGAADVASRWRWTRGLLTAAGLAAVAASAWATSTNVGYWASSERLFKHGLTVTTDNWLLENNLGVALAEGNRPDEARVHYDAAITLRPRYADCYNNLGALLAERGDLEGAIRRYRAALDIQPEFAEAHVNLAMALAMRGAAGDTDEAIREFGVALGLDRDNAQAHLNLGVLLSNQGHTDEAIDHYRKAIEDRPDYAEACFGLALLLADQGKAAEAARWHREAIAAARRTLARAAAKGDAQQAAQIRERLQIYESSLPQGSQ
jgi:tetratricopeptide (TPR) repeat protein